MNITYNNNLVSLEIDDPNHDRWSDICIFLNEEGYNFRNISENKIEVQFILFLNKKARLDYYLKDMEVFYDDYIEQLLKKSEKNKIPNFEKKIPIQNIEQILKNKAFKRNLTDFQKRNLEKIIPLSGAALFSVTGSGKTTEAIVYYFCNREPDSKLLIVAPKNAFPAWDEQIDQCIDNINIERLVGNKKQLEKKIENNPLICIITYETLIRNVNLIQKYLRTGNKNFIFLDESHKIKSDQSQRTKAALQISYLSSNKLILSATPMPQSKKDLDTQIKFLYPNKFIDVKDDNLSVLKPVFVRTTKKDLNLPELIRLEKRVCMSSQQEELNRYFIDKVLSHGLSRKDRSAIRKFSGNVMRLLQLASNPDLLLQDNIEGKDFFTELLEGSYSPKLEYVCNRARELVSKGKKVLIWSIFRKNIEIISNRLSDIGSDYIHGGVGLGSEDDDETREGKIKRFHEKDGCMVLIANPAACAEGISLHSVCHNAIYLDRNFNVAQYLQSEDRIHRYGLADNIQTIIEIVICKDSIDEVVSERLKQKTEKMAKVLEDPDLNIALTKDYDKYFEYEDELDEEKVNQLLDFEDMKAVENYCSNSVKK